MSSQPSLLNKAEDIADNVSLFDKRVFSHVLVQCFFLRVKFEKHLCKFSKASSIKFRLVTYGKYDL